MALNEQDDEIFEDATEYICPMDLDTAMEQAKLAVNYFFNNRFEEARQLMKPWADRSMYHALGYGTFMYLQAFLTFDPKDIEAAVDTLKKSVDVCNKLRRKNTISESLGKMVRRTDYNSYTEEEIHAELCYGECLLLRAVLSFIEDETLISFVKGSMKIRACYQSYKECWQILESRDFSNDSHKIHFESGVRMGVGTFNLMITMLPARVLKLLEFVGFTTSKSPQDRSDDNFGLRQLERGFALEGSLRRVLCALVLLGYHLFVTYVVGGNECDISTAQRILDQQLKLYPNGALFLFFKARLQFVSGSFTNAALLYDQSRLSQCEWKQFHHICYWELYWCSVTKGLYREGQRCADRLLKENKWSRAIYAYQKACCLCMRKNELNEGEMKELRSTMKSIPELRQKIAGKSLPLEKFAAKKSIRFFSQGESLMLPVLELIYIWNLLCIAAQKYENIERIYLTTESAQEQLEKIEENERSDYYYDDISLVTLIKGNCLTNMKSPLQAAECFKYVVSNEKKIREDFHLVPFALLELAGLHFNNGELDQAKVILEHTRQDYKGYPLEGRIHVRIHSLLNRIKAKQKKSSCHPRESFVDISEALGSLPNGSNSPDINI